MLEVVLLLKTYLIQFYETNNKYCICETKNPTKKQVNEYKMTKTEIYKKFINLRKKN